MKDTGLVHRICSSILKRLSTMSLGKTLCLIVVLKLFIIFAVLKLFFFPDFILTKVPDGSQADYVSSRMLEIAGESK